VFQSGLLPLATARSCQETAGNFGAREMGIVSESSRTGFPTRDAARVDRQMSRPELFAGHNGGLVAVGPSETEFATFNTPGMDGFNPAHPSEGQNVVLKFHRCGG
jgi:hypothetical protein